MRLRHIVPGGAAAVALLVLAGWTTPHLELTASNPAADAVLAEAPAEIWLRFSVVPDMAETTFSVEGPEGPVALGEISAADEPEIVRADVEGSMPEGHYTLSWVGAPLDDHAVRGRFSFAVKAAR
jgi:methionine-rich copper-binding protein CopC